jgi:hypothetical protein
MFQQQKQDNKQWFGIKRLWDQHSPSLWWLSFHTITKWLFPSNSIQSLSEKWESSHPLLKMKRWTDPTVTNYITLQIQPHKIITFYIQQLVYKISGEKERKEEKCSYTNEHLHITSNEKIYTVTAVLLSVIVIYVFFMAVVDSCQLLYPSLLSQ